MGTLTELWDIVSSHKSHPESSFFVAVIFIFIPSIFYYSSYRVVCMGVGFVHHFPPIFPLDLFLKPKDVFSNFFSFSTEGD